MTVTDKRMIRAVVLREIEKDGSINSFNSAAQKLMQLIRQDADFSEIAEVIKLEPGLTAKVLRLSNSAIYGGRSIKHVDDALFRIGMGEIRKMAMAMGVIDRVSHLRVKVDWNLFWLHSLLVARMTELLAHAYRETNGLEYMAGLLHDVGKLHLEHYLARDFEQAMLRAMERGCGMYDAENALLDTNHAEVSSLLCEKWHVAPEVTRSVRWHHEPASPFNKDPNHPEEQRLLATCLCVADALANLMKANIQGSKPVQMESLEELPQWQFLQEFTAVRSLDLDLAGEMNKAVATIQAFNPEDTSVLKE